MEKVEHFIECNENGIYLQSKIGGKTILLSLNANDNLCQIDVGKLKLLLDGNKDLISFQNSNSKVTLDKGEVHINADKITLEGQQSINLKTSGSFEVNAPEVKISSENINLG